MSRHKEPLTPEEMANIEQLFFVELISIDAVEMLTGHCKDKVNRNIALIFQQRQLKFCPQVEAPDSIPLYGNSPFILMTNNNAVLEAYEKMVNPIYNDYGTLIIKP